MYTRVFIFSLFTKYLLPLYVNIHHEVDELGSSVPYKCLNYNCFIVAIHDTIGHPGLQVAFNYKKAHFSARNLFTMHLVLVQLKHCIVGQVLVVSFA